MSEYSEKVKAQGIQWRAQLEVLSDEELRKFIWFTDRAERLENKRAYIKGIRATLYSLGYDDDFVNGKLYDLMLEEWND